MKSSYKDKSKGYKVNGSYYMTKRVGEKELSNIALILIQTNY